MSDRESLFEDAESTQSLCGDRCYCPHVGPCCHGDIGCCVGCRDEERRREIEDYYGEDG